MTKVLSHLPGLTHKDISVLSLGTCVQPLAIEPRGDDWGDWGLVQWAPHLLNLLSDSSNRSVNLHMTYLLGENYHRINPLLEKDIDMDDVDCFDTLKEIAEGLDLDETLEFVRSHLTAFPPASDVDWAASHQADADHRCAPPARALPRALLTSGGCGCSGTMSLKEVGAFLDLPKALPLPNEYMANFRKHSAPLLSQLDSLTHTEVASADRSSNAEASAAN